MAGGHQDFIPSCRDFRGGPGRRIRPRTGTCARYGRLTAKIGNTAGNTVNFTRMIVSFLRPCNRRQGKDESKVTELHRPPSDRCFSDLVCKNLRLEARISLREVWRCWHEVRNSYS